MRYFLCFCVLCLVEMAVAKNHFELQHTERSKIKFQFIDNLIIIIPVEVNGMLLSFILDSVASRPILFNVVNLAADLQLKNVEEIFLRGLGGEGEIKALKSSKNQFKIGNAICMDQDAFIIQDETINFSSRLGVVVHGIIGYDVLKDFVVEINYVSKFIRLNNPDTYKYNNCKNCETLPITFHNNKPFIDAVVEVNSRSNPVKLLIDTGEVMLYGFLKMKVWG